MLRWLALMRGWEIIEISDGISKYKQLKKVKNSRRKIRKTLKYSAND